MVKNKFQKNDFLKNDLVTNGVTMSRIGLRFCMQGAYHIRQNYRRWGGLISLIK